MRPLLSLAVLSLLAAASPGCGSASSADGSAPSAAVAPSAAAAPEAPSGTPDAAAAGLYALDTVSLEGEDAPLSEYAGQVTLVVNVASKCGYTSQYAGLQALQSQLEDRGFNVLGFPSNEFRGQEPGDAAEIRAFCTDTYGVTFPMFDKCETQPGTLQSPVYAYLEGTLGSAPSWNFCKYLVGKDGTPVAFFESRVAPDDPALLAAIESALSSS